MYILFFTLFISSLEYFILSVFYTMMRFIHINQFIPRKTRLKLSLYWEPEQLIKSDP